MPYDFPTDIILAGKLQQICEWPCLSNSPEELQVLRVVFDIYSFSAPKNKPPVRLELMRNSPDEELQQFASAAFKSVTAESEEHACGGTVAEHLRSLYRTEIEKSEKCK